jgi:hypothetical protein
MSCKVLVFLVVFAVYSSIPDVQVGNWKDWQPKEAIKGEREDIQSNLTLEELEILASRIPVDNSDDIDEGETIIVDIE